MSQPPCTFPSMSTPGRQRAEAHIRRSATRGENPWAALDAYSRQGGRIRWNDWFSLWKQISRQTGADERSGAVGGRHPQAS